MVSVLADAALKTKPPPRVGVGKMVAPRANTTRMEDFEVQRKLGQGSFGVVYAVTRKRDLAKRRTFVIKQVELGPRRSEQEAAIDECRVLSKMDSKYVVKYFESFITKGSKLCIVMEYAPKVRFRRVRRDARQARASETRRTTFLQVAVFVFTFSFLFFREGPCSPRPRVSPSASPLLEATTTTGSPHHTLSRSRLPVYARHVRVPSVPLIAALTSFASLYDYQQGTVHDLIKRNAPRGVSEDTAWRLILQSALGLAHIHGLKILHRDVKSENIFLDAKGDAKIGDLGVAKSLKNTNDLGVTLVGTPFYLSPELCDRRPYDAKSDVWSLGVVLYELLTGKPPFRARSQQELFLKILDGSYAPLPEKERGSSSGVSRDMRLLVRDMLETNVSRRVDAAGVATRPASVAKAKALGVDGVFEALNIDGTVDDATQQTRFARTTRRRYVKTSKTADRPRTAAASRGLRLRDIHDGRAREPAAVDHARGATRRGARRGGAPGEGKRIAVARTFFFARRRNVKRLSFGKKRRLRSGSRAERKRETETNDAKTAELSVVGGARRSPRGSPPPPPGGGAAGEAAAARHLAASPRFATNDPVAAAAAATAAQARAARQRALEQASEARRERERARERERQERRDANEEAAARQRRKVAAAAEASAAARARLASARARRVALSRGVGGSPTRIGHAAVSASRPETACAFSSDRPAGTRFRARGGDGGGRPVEGALGASQPSKRVRKRGVLLRAPPRGGGSRCRRGGRRAPRASSRRERLLRARPQSRVRTRRGGREASLETRGRDAGRRVLRTEPGAEPFRAAFHGGWLFSNSQTSRRRRALARARRRKALGV